MTKYRKLATKTTESLTVNEMPSDFYRYLWLMLPLIVCREGRGLYNAAWVKAKALPLRLDITPDDVQQAMEWYVNAGILIRYEVEGRGYFLITNWHKYQGNTEKEAVSIYPSPEEGQVVSSSGVSQELVKSDLGVHASASEYVSVSEYSTWPAERPFTTNLLQLGTTTIQVNANMVMTLFRAK